MGILYVYLYFWKAMKAWILLGTVMCCFLWCSYGYEPSLYEAERLQTAEKLLWSVPPGMQKDIEQKLLKQQDKIDHERKSFCVQYLLYQLQMIAKKWATTATTSAHNPALVTKIIDTNTFTVRIDWKEKVVIFNAWYTPFTQTLITEYVASF